MDILPYSDEFVKMHEEFSVKLWPNKKRRRSEVYNRWKFRGPENGTVNGLLLAISENKILGQLGLIPVTLISDGNEYEAQWACDLIVDHDHRKSGVGNKLFKTAMERDMITLGNNPSPKADALMTKAGFKPFKCGRLMVFPIVPRKLVNWAVPGKFSAINPVIEQIIKPYFTIRKNNLLKAESDFYICELGDIEQLISERQKNDTNPQIKHDRSFLNWRTSGFLNYFPKLKTIMSSKGSYALYSHFGVNFNIYEWHCNDETDFTGMFSYLFKECSLEKTEMVQAIANSENEMKWLSKAGFIKSRNDEKVIYYTKEDPIKNSNRFYFTLYDTDLNL